METRVVISLGCGGGKACLGTGGEMSSGVVFSKEESPGSGDYFRVLSSRCDEVRGRCAPKAADAGGYSGLTGLLVTGASG